MDHNQNKFKFIVFIELTAFVYIDDDTKNLILSHLRVGRSSIHPSMRRKKDVHTIDACAQKPEHDHGNGKRPS